MAPKVCSSPLSSPKRAMMAWAVRSGSVADQLSDPVVGVAVRDEVSEVDVVGSEPGAERLLAVGQGAVERVDGPEPGDGSELRVELGDVAVVEVQVALEFGLAVCRDADRAGRVLEAALDRLADPPGGVGGEPEPAGGVESVDGGGESGVAVLDEVFERHRGRAAHAAGDGHDETDVGADEVVASIVCVGDQGLELGRGTGPGDHLGGFPAGGDAAGEFSLLGGGEERDLGVGMALATATPLIDVEGRTC